MKKLHWNLLDALYWFTSFINVRSLTKIALMLVLLAVPLLRASNVTLAWDQTPDPTVNAYGVYMGTQSRAYTNFIHDPCCSGTFSNLVPGVTYYFAATSIATNGLESDFSTEVVYTVPTTNPPPPGIPAPPVIQSLKRTQ